SRQAQTEELLSRPATLLRRQSPPGPCGSVWGSRAQPPPEVQREPGRTDGLVQRIRSATEPPGGCDVSANEQDLVEIHLQHSFSGARSVRLEKLCCKCISTRSCSLADTSQPPGGSVAMYLPTSKTSLKYIYSTAFRAPEK